MGERYCNYFIQTDAADAFLHLGFCPDVVRLTNLTLGDGGVWSRLLGNDAILQRVTAGDYTNQTDKGIKLVKFEDVAVGGITADPTVVEPDEWYEANGIQITADLDALGTDEIMMVEAWRIDNLWIKAIHDGGDNCIGYMQDASIDFKKAGVEGGQLWMVYNQTDGDYGFVGAVQKPAGQAKYCRLTLVDAAGNAFAVSDVDDSDVLFIFRRDAAHWPMSDVVMMT